MACLQWYHLLAIIQATGTHDCAYLGHPGWHNTNWVISISDASPKVAEESSVVPVTCCWRWHSCGKLCQWKYSFKVR
jgi:hypothetical protein